MKHVILLRHAKSIPLTNDRDDYKRTLNEKGRTDAPKVSLAFSRLDIQPDIVLCSSAARTRETLELFLPLLNKGIKIIYEDNLYHAPASVILDIINQYTAYNNIMVVGHNFGISQLADYLSETGAEEMNTCGLYVLKFQDEISIPNGRVLHYLSPKNC